MYLPKHFAVSDPARLHDLMRAFPLATIVTHGPDGLEANHVPLLLDTEAGPHGTLRGHVARGNPLARQTVDSEILVIFQGDECYISPSGYATKAENSRSTVSAAMPMPVSRTSKRRTTLCSSSATTLARKRTEPRSVNLIAFVA